MVDGVSVSIGCVLAGASRHDSPLLRPALGNSTGASSTCPMRSRRIWMPTVTRRKPAIYSLNLAVGRRSAPKVSPCRSGPGGWWSGRVRIITVASRNCRCVPSGGPRLWRLSLSLRIRTSSSASSSGRAGPATAEAPGLSADHDTYPRISKSSAPGCTTGQP